MEDAQNFDDWKDLLRLVQGVTLSASLGAFVVSGVPQMLISEAHTGNRRLLWIVLTLSVLVIAFDAWYQFVVNGRFLHFGTKATPSVVLALIASMVWTSFLPFLFLVRVLDPSSLSVLNHQPVNKLFWFCLLITMLVEIFFIALVALRAFDHEDSAGHPTSSKKQTTEVNTKAGVVVIFRSISLIIIFVIGLSVLNEGSDSLKDLIVIVVSWFALRIIETLVAYLMDRKAVNGFYVKSNS